MPSLLKSGYHVFRHLYYHHATVAVVIKDEFAMKIGIDCRLWNETGVGRYIRNMVKELGILDKKDEYVLFVLGKDEQEIIKQVQNDNFKIVKADIRWHSLNEQLSFPKILNRENLDLVHFPYFSVPIFYNKPFVVTIHDLIPYHFSTGEASSLLLPLYKLKLLGYKFVINHAAKKSKKIITVSNTTKEELVDHLGVKEGKISVIYEGVDSAVQKSKVKNQNLKLQFKSKKYFLYVGNAYPHKNLDRLLEAFSTLNFQPSTVNLILVGKENYFYKRLREKVSKMRLKESVMFYGEATDYELASLYKNALALIMPSLMEGFGLPALEAMANKCLVVASDTPSLKETCGNAALYFDPLSVEELSDKLNIITLHTTVYGDLDELRKRGIERAKKFSWQKMAKETLAVYEQAASHS